MAQPNSPSIQHAGTNEGAGNASPSATHSAVRAEGQDRAALTWGSSALAEEGNTFVEVDEANEADVWNLSIDTPAVQMSLQIDGSDQLHELIEFLARSRKDHPLGPSGELRMGRTGILWAWDNETPGRLFIRCDVSKKHIIWAVLDAPQVNCIRSALADATRP